MIKVTKLGFTLIEILVVVLIIGILGAIMLPQYQRAVLKSRYSGMMPIAKALAEGNEVFFLEHGHYSENPADLVIAGRDKNDPNAYPDGTRIVMYSDAEDLSFVRTENDNISNARYVVYQKHSKNFADTTMCEAADERADELCVALGGVPLPSNMQGNSSGSGDWNVYLLSGQLKDGDSFGGGNSGGGGTSGCQEGDPAPDDMPVIDTSATTSNTAIGTPKCINGKWKYEWTDGATYGNKEWPTCSSEYACAGSNFLGPKAGCEGRAAYACAGSTFGETTECEGRASYACDGVYISGTMAQCSSNYAYGCSNSTFSGDKSYCRGGTANACMGSEIQAGAYCLANGEGGCDDVTYTTNPNKETSLTGCCTGEYCPSGSPKCKMTLNEWGGHVMVWNEDEGAYEIDGTW